MSILTPHKKKHFHCDCGWSAHGIVFETDEDGFLDIYINMARHDLTLWQRIKAAWAMVVGGDHLLSGVILDRDEIQEFVDYVCTLVHNEDTA